ncbi:hypothetical protein EV175_000183 [Coemansia sp. RSA 1933]|nr:hypothetical protein EV175_000183 [Coemansia sp. RSA 1933]
MVKQVSLWKTSLALVFVSYGVSANLAGSGTISYNDYQAIPLASLQYNPPSCGMPYAELDLTRITAVQQMDTATDCGKCIKVTNANNPSLCVYVLAVDTGGRGLDLSKPAFGKIFDIDAGLGAAEWAPADSSYCAGIWTTGSSQGSDSSSSVAVSSAPAQSPTTVVQAPASTAVYVSPAQAAAQAPEPTTIVPPTSSAQPVEQTQYAEEAVSELAGIGHNAEELTSADDINESSSVAENDELASLVNENIVDDPEEDSSSESSAASPAAMRGSLAGVAALAAVAVALL